MTAFKDLLETLFQLSPQLGFTLIYLAMAFTVYGIVLLTVQLLVGRKIALNLDPLFRHFVEKRTDLYWTSDLPSLKGDRARHYAVMMVCPDKYLDIPKARYFDFKERLGPNLYWWGRFLGWNFLFLERFALYGVSLILLLSFLNLLRNLGAQPQNQLQNWWLNQPSRVYELLLWIDFWLVVVGTVFLQRFLLPPWRALVSQMVPLQFQFRPPVWLVEGALAFHLALSIALPFLYKGKRQRAGLAWGPNQFDKGTRLLCALYAFAAFAFGFGIIFYCLACIFGWLTP